ncbi:MAG: PAS domain S-box protein [Candidatus Bathyarchaeia archaeon]
MSDRKRRQKALRRSKERPRGIIERSLDAIAALDLQGRFTYLSPAVERIIGYRPEEIVGRPLKEFLPEFEIPKVAQAFNGAVKGRSIEGVQFNIRRSDGSLASLELNGAPILKDGEVVGLQGTIRDITERKRMEAALRKSQELLRSIFASSPDAITVTDLNGNIVEFNQATLDLHGYSSREELAGRNAFELIAERDRERAARNMKVVLEQGSARDIEYTFLTRDGREFPAELSASVLRDPAGNPTGFMAITKDISGRKRAEEELRLRAELLDAAIDAILLNDLDGSIIYANEACHKLLGYTRDELLKMNVGALFPLGSNGLLEPEVKRLMERGEAAFESLIVGKGGSATPVEVHARIVKSGGRRLVLSVGRDITERKKVEEMKSRFISVATHELRTPLVSIKGYVDYILTGKLGAVPVSVKPSLEVVKRNTDRLLRITDDLLDIQRLASGRLPLYVAPLDLREVVDDCVKAVQPLFDERRQSFRLEAPDGPLLIKGDRIRLSQVVMNILSNAVKFTPQGGEITVRVEDREDAVQVQVSDTGIGIRKEDLERVFEPLADIKKPGYIKGTGLGLSVAKGLVEAHGGKMWAYSEGEGKGSTFTFTLPKQRGKGAS